MDPDAMTTLLGDAICNIEEEDYWEACQHALKSPYEARTTDDKDEEGGESLSDDDEGSDNKSDSSSDSGHSGDNNSSDSDSDSDNSRSEDYDSQYSGNDKGEPPSDREDEDVGLFYEDHFDDDVNYYNGDIEDDVEAEDVDIEDDAKAEDEDIENDVEVEDEDIKEYAEEGIDYDVYRRPSNWSCITDVSSRSCPRYDKHSREIPELGSFHNLELSSLTPYTEEEDDIDARLATLDRKLMIHSFRNLALEEFEDEYERMGGE